jgi:hypothetical protein
MQRARLPRRFRASIELLIDPPFPASQARATELERKIRNLPGQLA